MVGGEEESFWKQKCKNRWLVAGDLNTKVFHGWAKSLNNGKGVAGRHTGIENSTSGVRQHHNNLADKIMPLLAPSIPPGFEPLSSVVASKVFEQMIIYMNCADSEERLLREAKMKKMLNELSHDPIAQRSCFTFGNCPKSVNRWSSWQRENL
uniref:Uncharacterized protein n=1 Tax=Brassica oleracea TaxID=3712 RepID=A0A3P6F4S7_BRAOL|nr:unnamed protein product [Brassica oleracea]